jgi:hypothetical protein
MAISLPNPSQPKGGVTPRRSEAGVWERSVGTRVVGLGANLCAPAGRHHLQIAMMIRRPKEARDPEGAEQGGAGAFLLGTGC